VTEKILFFINSFITILKKVLDKIKELEIVSLYNLSYNYSSEGGFELPKTTEWCEHLNNHPNKYVR
jgi:hypothetical protein